MDGTREWGGRLLLAPGAVVYAGPGGVAAPHRHLAVQAIRAVEGRFTLRFGGGRLNAQSALVASGVEHELDAEGLTVVIGLIEPTGQLGAAVEGAARELAWLDIDDRLPELGQDAPTSVDELLGGLLEPPGPGDRPPPIGDHVRAAIEFVEANLDAKVTLTAAAEEIAVSGSRLTHLFTEQVGIPFRRYVLWARLRRVVEEVAAGSSLGRAAVDAGFSDSSHLSRVFKENFGLSPSAILTMELSGGWLG